VEIDHLWAHAYILKAFAAKRAKNQAYSLRAYARTLSVSAPALSEFLAGKRRFSSSKLRLILEKLAVPAQVIDQHLVPRKPARGRKTVSWSELKKVQYEILTDWTYLAVFSYIGSFDGDRSPRAIAKYFGFSVAEIEKNLSLLLKVGLIKKAAKDDYRVTGHTLSSSDEKVNLALQRAHVEGLRLAEKSIRAHQVDERDFTTFILAIDPKNLREAKKIIRKCHRQIAALEERGAKTEVYRLNVQFHPLRGLQ
jgi:hypothetical protein